jgi:ribosomal protein S18 acetylase RimI-like enzyme
MQGHASMAGRSLWARILAVDEESHEYFAQREDRPGAIVFTNAAVSSCNLALLTSVEPAHAGELLESLIQHFRALNVQVNVRVTPFSRPRDWRRRLAARGFVPAGEGEVFMLLQGELAASPEPPVQVRRVPQEAGAGVFVRTSRVAWEVPEGERTWDAERTGQAIQAGRYRFYVAFHDGAPAATATARLSDGLVGIYGLGTVPALRRHGIGTALLRHIIQEARRDGYPQVVLSAEPHGYAAALYQRLGFVPLFQVADFQLPAAPLPPA